jgi:hypothetical protein
MIDSTLLLLPTDPILLLLLSMLLVMLPGTPFGRHGLLPLPLLLLLLLLLPLAAS